MTLKDGKFYKDGQPYPLEFGNKDQIALMNKFREAKENGVCADIDLNPDNKTFSHYIKCVCGAKTKIGEYISGAQRKCTGCKLVYLILEDDDFGFPYIKII